MAKLRYDYSVTFDSTITFDQVKAPVFVPASISVSDGAEYQLETSSSDTTPRLMISDIALIVED